MADQIIRIPIELTDPTYFCERSFTVSFNMNTKSWISFHSYIPSWYIGENNFFYSGQNICCSDFDFIAQEVPSEDCKLRGTVYYYTTTTTSTSSSSTTTTTTTNPCELEGEVYQRPHPSTTTTTSTEGPCYRPEELSKFILYTGYTTPYYSIVSTGSALEACDAEYIYMNNIDPDLVFDSIVGFAVDIALGQTVYLGYGTGCECVPDGWYFTDEFAYYGNVFHVENCIVTEIVSCEDLTTTTTTSTTTEPPPSTTTTSTTLPPVPCLTNVFKNHFSAYPYTREITLGSGIGSCKLAIGFPISNPVRKIVRWNGSTVIDTGYKGSASFDYGNVNRNAFKAVLIGKTDPITGNVYPDFATYTDDGYPRVSSTMPGFWHFYKSLASPTYEYVDVYAPLPNSVFVYQAACPIECDIDEDIISIDCYATTTTTTLYPPTTTTTTTTIIPHLLTLKFDDKANADLLVGDSTDLGDWNAFFDLPTNGTPFSNILVTGTVPCTIDLSGGDGITLATGLFGNSGYGENLLEVIDTGCIVTGNSHAFGDLVGSGCPNLTKAILPELTTTGTFCFSGCSSLVDVDFTSLTTAGNGTFADCVELVSPDFDNLTTIGQYCFDGCTKLESDFPSLTNVENGSFRNCEALNTDFNLLTTINDSCFYGCISLTSPDFSSVTTISDTAFYGCTSLTNPDFFNVTTIGSFSFRGCTSLISPYFQNVTSVGSYAFQACSGLTTPHFPVLTIAGDYAFSLCTSMVNPDFSSLITAGDACFFNSSALVNPDFSSLQTAGDYTFSGDTSLTSDFPSLITADIGCFQSCTGLTTPDFSSLTSAGENCFRYCSNLSNPDFSSLVTIGNKCFENNVDITTLSIPACTTLGTTTGDNQVFNGILGKTITITILHALESDGDIVWLKANNTVTVNYSD